MSKNEQELYTSPEMKVVEIKVSQIVCASGNPLDDYTGNEW